MATTWFTSGSKEQPWTKGKVLFVALAIRLTLVLYSNIHDYVFNVNFTDVDYHVYSDAAHHVAVGGSPYDRATYRYTPVLAWLLLPNEKWKDFGKFLFCVFDIVVGWLCFQLMSTNSNSFSVRESKPTESSSTESKVVDEKEEPVSELDERIFPVVVFWLANPLTAIISARGNADTLVCAAVLFTLYLLQDGKWMLAAIAHGVLAIHLKIYPVIYLPSIFIYLSDYSRRDGWRNKLKALVGNLRGYIFVAQSLLAFLLVVIALYLVYGEVFLEEFLFYHIKRRDIRHNFSPYFLPLYLANTDQLLSKIVGLAAFIPQLVFVVVFAFRYSSDLPFCWFLTTFAFVAFNKVCTSQYFVWYIVFLPLIADRIKISRLTAVYLIGMWFLGQGIWLLFAYQFEFLGWPVFEYIWLASLFFAGVNCYIMRRLMQSYVAPEPGSIAIDRKKVQ